MKHFSFKRFVSMLLVLVLLAAAALATVACENKQDDGDGEEKTFTFIAVMKDGTEKRETVTTTKTTVGDALVEKNLISGDIEQYGLYVKTVFGETLDYETDGMYWAFYIGETYAPAGVDQTKITDGASYMFKAES